MSRHNVLRVIGVLYLTTAVLCGVADTRGDEKDKPKDVEGEKKKPNILRDYVCLRDGELCHPDFGKNRGLYVSCSNGIAWEQTCPKCVYHPIACPTKSLWFDGEKCEWASPKLASQPCIDKIPLYEMNNITSSKDASMPQQQAPGMMSEQEALFQSLQAAPMQVPMSMVNQMKDQYSEKNKWQVNPMSNPGPGHFKSPKSGPIDNEPSQFIDMSLVEHKESDDNEKEDDQEAESDNQDLGVKNRRKSAEENEAEFPTYLSPDEASMGSKIVRLSEPVYALVNSPNGSGKQVLMRVFQPFVLEDAGRGLLPSILAHGE